MRDDVDAVLVVVVVDTDLASNECSYCYDLCPNCDRSYDYFEFHTVQILPF